jgi:FMN phosphatase YigB (HAD superfamily)
MIKHIWFDFSDTIARVKKAEHDKLRYQSYATAIGKSVTPELIKEYEALYREHKNSNAAVFSSLGFPSGYWSDRINSTDPSKFYLLANSDIPSVLKQMKDIMPIFLFSNLELDKVLPPLGIDAKWFSHILSSGMVKNPKPALDGFYKLIKLSALPPDEILYIGDDIEKDILPAKAVGLKTGIIWKKAAEADYSFKNFEDILEVMKVDLNSN